jgi:hypothetical protein
MRLHFAPNDNFGNNNEFLPGPSGFTLADVGSVGELKYLPADVKAMVWVGACDGVDRTFKDVVTPFLGNPKVFGYYLMDEPDPAQCLPQNMAAETAWIHQHDPGKLTFTILLNLSASATPKYSPKQAGMCDLYGLDPYPIRPSDAYWKWIGAAVQAALKAGFPPAALVPVYQTFGGGSWVSDTDEPYQLPTPSQLAHLITVWNMALPNPPMDVCYAWGSQHKDTALEQSPELQSVISQHNSNT